jgi:alkyl sulfatase BDS1-like metallo-beta-lactamase superfamily hydrolase
MKAPEIPPLDRSRASRYRWVAEIMVQVVFADPSNEEARSLAGGRAWDKHVGTRTCTDRRSFLAVCRADSQRVRCQSDPNPLVRISAMLVPPVELLIGVRKSRFNRASR